MQQHAALIGDLPGSVPDQCRLLLQNAQRLVLYSNRGCANHPRTALKPWGYFFCHTFMNTQIVLQANITGPFQHVHPRSLVTFEPWHGISNNLICATSKTSDQPAHTRSLIRAFAGRLDIL